MTPNTNETFFPPDLKQVLLSWRDKIAANLRCSLPASILSFDTATGLATVQPLIQRVLSNGTASAFQPLLDVPVFCPQGGGCAFQAPISKGDNCLLVFCDRDTSTWLRTGAQGPPPSIRTHDLSDAFAFVGINSLNNSLPAYSASEIRMITPGAARIGVDKITNLATVQNQTTSLLVLLQNLGTILEGATIDTVHGVFGPTTVTALTAWVLSLQELLY